MVLFTLLQKRGLISVFGKVRIRGEMAELAEGAPLLREYGAKSFIEGSNPSLSASLAGFADKRLATAGLAPQFMRP